MEKTVNSDLQLFRSLVTDRTAINTHMASIARESGHLAAIRMFIIPIPSVVCAALRNGRANFFFPFFPPFSPNAKPSVPAFFLFTGCDK